MVSALNMQERNECEETKHEEKKNKKGYMALKNSIYDLKLELWHILKPLEMHLVDIIIDRTIKWRETEAKIDMDFLVKATRQRKDHIYIALKNLETSGVIVRRKVKHDTFIGLNEEYFGALLIKKHQDALLARRNTIKIVVDNAPKSKTEIRSNSTQGSVQEVPDSGTVQTKIRSKIDTQPHEIIRQNLSLNTLLKDIPINTLLKDSENRTGNGESFTLLGTGTWNRKTEKPKIAGTPPEEVMLQRDWIMDTNGHIPFETWKSRRA